MTASASWPNTGCVPRRRAGRRSRSTTRRCGRRLEFLPPYCPQENRIERLWLDLHANVTRNHRRRTMPELMAAVHHDLSSRFDLVQVQARAA